MSEFKHLKFQIDRSLDLSKKVQEKLISLGYSWKIWGEEEKDKSVKGWKVDYLYTNSDGRITWSYYPLDTDPKTNCKYEEVKASQFLGEENDFENLRFNINGDYEFSRRVQEKLFSLGYRWLSLQDDEEPEVINYEIYYLHTNENGIMTRGFDDLEVSKDTTCLETPIEIERFLRDISILENLEISPDQVKIVLEKRLREIQLGEASLFHFETSLQHLIEQAGGVQTIEMVFMAAGDALFNQTVIDGVECLIERNKEVLEP